MLLQLTDLDGNAVLVESSHIFAVLREPQFKSHDGRTVPTRTIVRCRDHSMGPIGMFYGSSEHVYLVRETPEDLVPYLPGVQVVMPAAQVVEPTVEEVPVGEEGGQEQP